MKTLGVRDAVARWAIVGAYAALVLARLDYPEVHWEECRSMSVAVGAIQHWLYLRPVLSVELFGLHLPVMQSDHLGALLDYLMFPVLRLFGVNLVVVRLSELALSIAVALVYSRVAERAASSRAGILTLFMILFHSSFFAFAKTGFWGETLLQQLMIGLAAGLFLRCLAAPRFRNLFAWGFVLGLGFWVKLLLLWQAVAYFAFFFLGGARAVQGRARWVKAAVFVLGMAATPFAVANLARGGEFARAQISRFSGRAQVYGQAEVPDSGAPVTVLGKERGYGLADYLRQRGRAAAEALGNGYSMLVQPPRDPPLWQLLACLAVFGFPLVFVFQRRAGDADLKAAVTGWLFVCLVFYGGLCLPVANPGRDHALPMVPLMVLAAAVAIDRMIRGTAALAAVAGVFYAGHFARIATQFRPELVSSYGGARAMLVDRLLTRGITSPCVLGLASDSVDLAILSGGRLRPLVWNYAEPLSAEWYVDSVWFYSPWPKDSEMRREEQGVRRRIDADKVERDVESVYSHNGLAYRIFRLEDKP